MNRHRIETAHTVWEFDLDNMRYYRHPKNESPDHPVPGAKPFEHRWVEFDKIKVVATLNDGFTKFHVYNTGVEWGEGAVTQSYALPGQDLAWIEEVASVSEP